MKKASELLCLNKGVELWEGFTPITKETAMEYFKKRKCEVFGLDYGGFESLICQMEDFEDFEMFVIDMTMNKISELYFCEDCSNETETTLTCNKCGAEICFDCAYLLEGITECPSCYMAITEFKCQVCGKLITENDGITAECGSWVCDNDSCRTLDNESKSHIIIR